MNLENYYRFINLTELGQNDPQYLNKIDTDIELKPHQLTLIHKCLEREKKGISLDDEVSINHRYNKMKCDIGIIADQVGSGKSYVILSIIASNTIPADCFQINSSYGHGHIVLENADRFLIDKDVNILVIPHVLVSQWCKTVESFSKNMKYFLVNKTRSIDQLENEINNNKTKLIIVTGTFYRHIRAMFYTNKWRVNRIFFDEVDSTNTPSAHYMFCRFMWFVTASYKNIVFPIQKISYDYRNPTNTQILSNGIVNNTFVKNMFVNTIKNMGDAEICALDKIIIKNEDAFVNGSFKLPPFVTRIALCRSPIEVSVLSGIVNRDIITCLNAGDIQSAKEFINQTNIGNEANIIQKALSELQTCLSNCKIRKHAVEQLSFNNEERRIAKLNKLDTEIKEIDNKIIMMKQRIENSKLCIICFNTPCNKSISKCCKNSFCLQCITHWLAMSTKCPLCKTDVNIVEDFYVIVDDISKETKQDEDFTKFHENLPGDDEYTKSLDKFQNLERIISKRKSYSKFLIFSDYEKSFSHMLPILDKSGLKYANIKGPSCKNTVEKYRNHQLDALLINSRNYGSGLNLENTTDIIMFHKFDDQMEKQIIGRAQRPGRTETLTIWYLLNDNEIV